jgi:hypothetical protein
MSSSSATIGSTHMTGSGDIVAPTADRIALKAPSAKQKKAKETKEQKKEKMQSQDWNRAPVGEEFNVEWRGPFPKTFLRKKAVGIDGKPTKIYKEFNDAVRASQDINSAWDDAYAVGGIAGHKGWKHDQKPVQGITQCSTGFDLRSAKILSQEKPVDWKTSLCSWTLFEPARFEPVEPVVNSVVEPVDEMVALKQKISELEGNVASMEGKVASMEGNVASMEGKVASMEGNVASMEKVQQSMRETMKTLAKTILEKM